MTPTLQRWLGWLLLNVRCGEQKLLCNSDFIRDKSQTILITSPSFRHGQPMPVLHAGEGVGNDISPELKWSGLPRQTEELILILQVCHAASDMLQSGFDYVTESFYCKCLRRMSMCLCGPLWYMPLPLELVPPHQACLKELSRYIGSSFLHLL